MNDENYSVNKDMLEALELQIFANRLEKRKNELLPPITEEVYEKVQRGVPYELAIFEAAQKLIDEVWENNDNET